MWGNAVRHELARHRTFWVAEESDMMTALNQAAYDEVDDPLDTPIQLRRYWDVRIDGNGNSHLVPLLVEARSVSTALIRAPRSSGCSQCHLVLAAIDAACFACWSSWTLLPQRRTMVARWLT